MIELVQLEKRHADFADRNVRLVVVSLDDKSDAEKTQTQFPHLTIVADTDARLIKAAGVLHEHARGDEDAAAPTTILIDKNGVVRWIFRPEGVMRRLSPDELLAAIDRELK